MSITSLFHEELIECNLKSEKSSSQVSNIVVKENSEVISELIRNLFPNPLEVLQSKDDETSMFNDHIDIHAADGKTSIGQVIRIMRKEKGFSQEGLAKRTHIDRTTIARVESGVFKSLSIGKLEAIAQAFGIDLKALLHKCGSEGEALTLRGHVSRVEFALEYPEAGFRIISFIPKRKEFFFGKIEIQPHRTIPSDKLPHPEQVYLHALEGKIVLIRDLNEFLLKPGDCFAFSGFSDYELFNPDQLKKASSFFISYPSFLPV